MAGMIQSSLTRPLSQRRSRAGGGLRRALGAVAGAATLVAATAVTAHGSHDATMALRHISGTYAVSTVAGKPVPATALDTMLADASGVPFAHATVVIRSGTVRLDRSGNYRVQVEYAVAVNGQWYPAETRTEAGTYVLAGSTITFRSPAGDVVASGTLADESLTVPGRLLDIEALTRSCLSNGCTNGRM